MAHVRRKILCIEDDRETAGLIAEELADRGFEVSMAYGGQEGLMAIMKATPDLILCDVSMPAMTGFELLERLNEIAPRLGRIPLVFLTALADRENELKGRRLGADDYVTKPIDFDRLCLNQCSDCRRRTYQAVAEDCEAERSRDRSSDLGIARQDVRRDRTQAAPVQTHS
jgi:DNA-binding response OmpR family regulator